MSKPSCAEIISINDEFRQKSPSSNNLSLLCSFVRPKNKKILNNNTQDYRYSQQYELSNGSSPNFHNYPPAIHTMHGSSGHAYVQNGHANGHANGHVQACAPAPVYVNAPPKPRRTSTVNPVMVTGQYQQPMNEVQHAHQRYLPTPVSYEPPTPNPRPDYSRSLGRVGGSELLRQQYQYQYPQPNNYFGSMGRSSGAMMAPRTPMMGRQIKARRYSQMPQRPKSRYVNFS